MRSCGVGESEQGCDILHSDNRVGGQKTEDGEQFSRGIPGVQFTII